MTSKLMKALVVFSLIAGFIIPGAHAQTADASKDKSDPAKWHEEGLYYYNKADANNLFMLIDPSVANGIKQGSYGQSVGQYYSGGLSSKKEKAVLAGGSSKTVIHDKNPVFYFYFKADNVTPKAFVLATFDARKHERTLVMGSTNAFGSSKGIDQKQLVDFSYTKVSDGIYKVYLKDPLPEGEYCFYYLGKDQSPFAENFYDFGITE